MDKWGRGLGCLCRGTAALLLSTAVCASDGARALLVQAAEPPALEALSFGVVPQQATRDLVKRWTPLLRQLEARTGISLQFETARDIPTFEGRVRAGEYDFAYMNPYHYTVFHDTTGYTALVKEADTSLQGILVVQADAELHALEDLRGQTLAFPSVAAFAASLLPRAALARARIPHQARYVASHDSVYRAVAMGLYPAGGGITRTFDALDPALRAQLRILWTTPAYTPHPIAVHPRVAPDVAQRLQLALVQMTREGEDGRLLEALGFKGFEAARDADYDDTRALSLTLLDTLVQE